MKSGEETCGWPASNYAGLSSLRPARARARAASRRQEVLLALPQRKGIFLQSGVLLRRGHRSSSRSAPSRRRSSGHSLVSCSRSGCRTRARRAARLRSTLSMQRGRDVVNTLSLLFRVLAALLAMEVMELVFKMLEDYAICDGPVAAAARRARGASRGALLRAARHRGRADVGRLDRRSATSGGSSTRSCAVEALASVSAGAARVSTRRRRTQPPPRVQFATTVIRD